MRVYGGAKRIDGSCVFVAQEGVDPPERESRYFKVHLLFAPWAAFQGWGNLGREIFP